MFKSYFPNRIAWFLRLKHTQNRKSERLKNQKPKLYKRVAGQRVRDPPDPIPNSAVKPRSVSGASVVFGHVKPEKLAAPLQIFRKSPRLITQRI